MIYCFLLIHAHEPEPFNDTAVTTQDMKCQFMTISVISLKLNPPAAPGPWAAACWGSGCNT